MRTCLLQNNLHNHSTSQTVKVVIHAFLADGFWRASLAGAWFPGGWHLAICVCCVLQSPKARATHMRRLQSLKRTSLGLLLFSSEPPALDTHLRLMPAHAGLIQGLQVQCPLWATRVLQSDT